MGANLQNTLQFFESGDNAVEVKYGRIPVIRIGSGIKQATEKAWILPFMPTFLYPNA